MRPHATLPCPGRSPLCVQAAYLCIRGIKTLTLRVKQQNETAMTLAQVKTRSEERKQAQVGDAERV